MTAPNLASQNRNRRRGPAHLHLRTRHGRPSRALALSSIGAGVVVLLLVLDLLAFRGRVHPRVAVGGRGVGGLTLQEARERIADRAGELAQTQVRLTWEGRTFTTTPESLGWRPDPAATASAAYRVGRDGPPWRWAFDRARAWLAGAGTEWVQRWDQGAVTSVVDGWEEGVAVPAREGRVWIEGMEIRSSQPIPGRTIDRAALLDRLGSALNQGEGFELSLPVTEDRPLTSPEGIARAVRQAETIVSAPIRARVGTASLSIAPRQLARLFRADVDEAVSGLQPVVSFDLEGVERLLRPYEDDVERAPQSAEFLGRGKSVQIKPSRPGRQIDPEVAAPALLNIALSKDRTGRIPLVPTEAEFTTEEANALGIRKKISTFTTYYTPGEPRVTNIHLGADLLDGAIVKPGKVFSLNERLGQRTEDRGFVLAPAIVEGQFGEQVGGGISQLTTTLFNAAFFGGYPFLEYQAHSVYIDRYPEGREATLHWPHPDLKFRNDTDTPIVIDTDYTSSSITVTIYGVKRYRTVRASEPVVTDRFNGGYTVLVKRFVEVDGRVERVDHFVTTYRDLIEPSPSRSPRPRDDMDQRGGSAS